MRLLLIASAIPLLESRRVLCLHGSGGSASAFLARGLAPLREAASASYKDWRPIAWELDAIDSPGGQGSWWRYAKGERSFTATSYEGADESIAAVEAELAAGEYTGLLGFSQGAMLAAIVAARSSLGENDLPTLKFAVMCGGAMPKPYEQLLARLQEAPDTAGPILPTLHCLSAEDAINPPALGEELANCFPNAEVLWHGAGHQMPPKPRLKEVAAFMDKLGPDLR